MIRDESISGYSFRTIILFAIVISRSYQKELFSFFQQPVRNLPTSFDQSQPVGDSWTTRSSSYWSFCPVLAHGMSGSSVISLRRRVSRNGIGHNCRSLPIWLYRFLLWFCRDTIVPAWLGPRGLVAPGTSLCEPPTGLVFYVCGSCNNDI
jgi:hypothetical protein